MIITLSFILLIVIRTRSQINGIKYILCTNYFSGILRTASAHDLSTFRWPANFMSVFTLMNVKCYPWQCDEKQSSELANVITADPHHRDCYHFHRHQLHNNIMSTKAAFSCELFIHETTRKQGLIVSYIGYHSKSVHIFLHTWLFRCCNFLVQLLTMHS